MPFDSYDVLQSNEIRTALKVYSDFPTIPQLYYNGDFIGGFDIVLENFKSGELFNILKLNANHAKSIVNNLKKDK